jgi:NAD(P)H-hydrate epimerase
LVIDAVLGTGHLRPLGEPLMEIFRLVTEERRDRDNLVLLALDIPTGMDADTGAVDPSTPHFDVTVTLAYPKVGLFKFPGAARVGQLEVVDIGIPPRLAGSVNTELLTPEWVTSRLPERPPDAHKGTFGRLLIIAGSHNYVGAAVLAAEAAYRVGAGLVTVATPQSVYPLVAISVTEATHLPLPESGPGRLSEESVATLENAVEQYDAAVIGCGMGQYPEAQAVLGALLFKKPQKSIPAIIDADGLNNLARLENWWSRIRWPAILTPHPGEMARLTGSSTRDVQGDRLATARDHAARWDKVVVLKGAYSVVASPDGTAMVSPFANPALASAGTGDVLAGVIGGLLAQGMSPFDASACGVYLHAKAGEEARCDLGDAGLLARDLPGKLPTIMGLLKARHPQR